MCDHCRATSYLSHPITGCTLTRLTGAGQSPFCSLAVTIRHVPRERWLEMFWILLIISRYRSAHWDLWNRTIRKASLHADHPPMCLKMLCKCTIIQYCNASLCKNVRHHFRHHFVLFTFNSMLSFLFHYVNLPKGELFVNLCVSTLIDWGRVTHICVGNLAIIGSDNCLSPGRRHAIIWTDAGILLIGPSETDFNEILIKKSYIFIQENLFENVPW